MEEVEVSPSVVISVSDPPLDLILTLIQKISWAVVEAADLGLHVNKKRLTTRSSINCWE